jgi:hypothetical protein
MSQVNPVVILAAQTDILPNAVMIDITDRDGRIYNITISVLFSVVGLISICVWIEMIISDKR